MPWTVRRGGRDDSRWCVYKVGPRAQPVGAPLGCHGTEAEARAQQRALYANADVGEASRTAAVAPSPAAAGVALVAADTGRVLMIQRALIQGEPAGGKWEFPGGRAEEGEAPAEAAAREFGEEVGHPLPAGEAASTWLSPDGVYQGFVWLTPEEASLPILERGGGREVEDPDAASGNYTEAVAWFDPADLTRGWNGLREECKSTPWRLVEGATPASPQDLQSEEGSMAASAGETLTVRVVPELDASGLEEQARVAVENALRRRAEGALGEEAPASLVAALAAPASALLPERPLAGPTPYTVDADAGTADGHLALWASCHIGYPGCVRPPREDTFDFFNLGEAVTADGRRVGVGKVVVGAGHAGPELGWRTASAYYDHSGTAAAVAHAVADRWGIRLPSVLVAGVTGAQVDELRRSPLSGDWRRVSGRLRLVAALGVNTPGYPVPRALVASGEVQSMFVGFDPADAGLAVAQADEIAASLGLDRPSRAAALRREVLGS